MSIYRDDGQHCDYLTLGGAIYAVQTQIKLFGENLFCTLCTVWDGDDGGVDLCGASLQTDYRNTV